MQIFLTGAAGYIGGSVAAALVTAGHRVRGLTRDAATAQRLVSLGIEPVVGSLDDTFILTREARDADAVINTASSDHVGAVRALIAGLANSGKPLLHTSGSSVVGDDARGSRRAEQVFDEDTPFVVFPLKQARRELDLEVLASANLGVRSAVICPSLVYGVGRGLNKNSVQIPFLVANARDQGVVQVVGTGVNVWSNIHLDDLVALFLLALEKAPAGAFYFAENGEASFAELGAAIAKRLALPGVAPLAAEIAAAQWGEAKAYFTLGSNSRVRARRARRELGWNPHHASATDWILTDMPADIASTTHS